MRMRAKRAVGPANRQRGSTVVEMAIALPVLVFLMFGVVELGRVLFQYNTLTKANRDATRFLATHSTPGTTDTILVDPILEAQAKNLAVYGNTTGTGEPLLEGLSTDDVTVSVLDAVHVGINILWSYDPLFGTNLPTFGFSDDPISMAIDLQSTVIMRAL